MLDTPLLARRALRRGRMRGMGKRKPGVAAGRISSGAMMSLRLGERSSAAMRAMVGVALTPVSSAGWYSVAANVVRRPTGNDKCVHRRARASL